MSKKTSDWPGMPTNVKLTQLAKNRLGTSVTLYSYGHFQIRYLIWFPK